MQGENWIKLKFIAGAITDKIWFDLKDRKRFLNSIDQLWNEGCDVSALLAGPVAVITNMLTRPNIFFERNELRRTYQGSILRSLYQAGFDFYDWHNRDNIPILEKAFSKLQSLFPAF